MEMWIKNELSNRTFWSVFYKHILAWSIFMAYELIFIYVTAGKMPQVNGIVVNYILNMVLFYFNAHILLDYFGEKLKVSWVLIVALIALEVLVFIIIKYPVNLLFLGDRVRMQTSEEFRVYAVSNTLRSFYYIGFSTAYWFSIITVERNKKINDLETQRLLQQNEQMRLQKDLISARNAYLQSQVNPHFLFNTLNFMYNSSMKISEKLSNSILTLSDIMRYALTRIDEDQKVLLRNEIEHIKNFIDLNQVRFDQQLSIDFRVNGSVGDSRIIPLSLITIAENMFKYGDLLDPEYPASLVITLHENELEVEASNKKRAGRIMPGHGTGLKNLRERLDIYYADAYGLEIDDTDTQYKLKLTVILT